MARIRVATCTTVGNSVNVFSFRPYAGREKHLVERGGEEIALTAREFALLEFLMRNKNKVLSRQKIEDNVWSYDYEGGTNLVDVYITYPRKKVDGENEVKADPHCPGSGIHIEGRRMKRLSIKLKLTWWFAMAMVLLAGVFFAFITVVSNSTAVWMPAKLCRG